MSYRLTTEIPIIIKLNIITVPNLEETEYQSRVYRFGTSVFECVAPTRQEAQKMAVEHVYENFDVCSAYTTHDGDPPPQGNGDA